MSPSLFGLLARWRLFAALTLMVGAVAFRQIVVRGVHRTFLRYRAPPALAMAADAVHLVAAGAWLGGLTMLASTCGGALRSSTASPDYIPRSVTAFSPLALGAVTTLILTGTFAAWLHVGSLSQSWASPYGRVLTAKLLLVGVMALLGAYNWKRVTPRLGDPDGQSEFVRRSALAELVVGALILAATALLVASPMPMDG